jgi:hypothetical protein
MWCKYSPEWLDSSRNSPVSSVRIITTGRTAGERDAGYMFGGYGYNSFTEIPVRGKNIK